MKRYKWVLFDLDGTLLNTIEDITTALNHALQTCGSTFEINSKNTETFIGSGAKILIKRAMAFGKVHDDKAPEFTKAYLEYYASHSNIKTKPYPFVKELIELLKSYGLKIGVLSNKPHRDTTTCINYYFPNLFNYFSGQKDEIKPKPNTEAFDIFASLNNVKKEEVLYIGDMDVDLIFANNAGIDCALVTFGFGKNIEKLNPKYIINSFEEVLNNGGSL